MGYRLLTPWAADKLSTRIRMDDRSSILPESDGLGSTFPFDRSTHNNGCSAIHKYWKSTQQSSRLGYHNWSNMYPSHLRVFVLPY